ncbi:hypothetical protein FA13DRAFT_1717611 [Coprinellus micaceus]|uniref:Uncharacterized protein n=1 Tax=Coprinellus micaceus TaxID=71717 RepID=A0A4Y7SFS4_COPMI|nr:hypothetical protein FA13DRAFT_1717611 [Coprinellus micaceus]
MRGREGKERRSLHGKRDPKGLSSPKRRRRTNEGWGNEEGRRSEEEGRDRVKRREDRKTLTYESSKLSSIQLEAESLRDLRERRHLEYCEFRHIHAGYRSAEDQIAFLPFVLSCAAASSSGSCYAQSRVPLWREQDDKKHVLADDVDAESLGEGVFEARDAGEGQVFNEGGGSPYPNREAMAIVARREHGTGWRSVEAMRRKLRGRWALGVERVVWVLRKAERLRRDAEERRG